MVILTSPVERTLVAFTITILASAHAHASHLPQTITNDGSARPREFVTTSTRAGTRELAFARQVLPAQPVARTKALSRTIYLNRDGVTLRPGDNDARAQKSSIVSEPVELTPWDIDDDTWAETVSCMRDLYSRFDVTITDRDPGDVPHIEAVFGGHPSDVGLPDNVAGVSPFTSDCSVIENSVVFTFTDVLPDDPRLMCEVMAQEIAHSFGLDHEMLPSDPMTYLDYDDERTFQDEMAPCGEDGDRMCGINGSICREEQNSVQLLETRLGRRGSGAPDDPTEATPTGSEGGGCRVSSGSVGGFPLLLALGLLVRRRRQPS